MPKPEITIVEATTPQQLDAVRELFHEYAESLGWDLSQNPGFLEEIAGLPGTYAPPEGSLMLALADGEPAGALGLQPVPAQARIEGSGAECCGELKRLFVRPAYRSHGVGRALMKRSEAEALARGYRCLALTTSAEMMPLAQPLYDSLGYVVTEPYRNDMPYPGIRWLRLSL